MTTLLTGSTGFVGRSVVELDPECKVVLRENEQCRTNSSFIISQLDNNTVWDNAFHDINNIIHLAGLAHSHTFSGSDYQSVNVDGTLHLAREAAKAGVSRFVFVSSIGVHGTSTLEAPFSISSKLQPHNAYAKSKLDAELGLKKIASETGMELVIVRPTLVYGAYAPGNFGALTRLVSKVPFLPFGLAKNRRDFISVNNLADLLITCATHPNAGGHTFLASDGETVSTKQFTNAISKGLEKKVIQLPIPVSLIRLAGKLSGKSAMIEQLFGNLEVDSSNIKQVLGWTPPLTMEQAMASLRYLENDK